LGGFKLALMAYKKLVGPQKYRREASKFIDLMVTMFCGRLSGPEMTKMMMESYHPPDECRLKLISHSMDFINIKFLLKVTLSKQMRHR
jgi:hypothetical protein